MASTTSKIVASSSQLRNQANQLKSMNETFKRSMSNLKSQQQSLTAMWDGDANTAFDRQFNTNYQECMEFYTLINQYVEALQTAANTYDRVEAQNQSIATTP